MPDEALTARLARRTLDLVLTPSPYGNEARLCDAIERTVRGRFSGGDVVRVGNSIAAGRPSGLRPAVALVGHLDTVPPHEGEPEPVIRGDRVVGLGASDMKSGLAVALELADDLDLAALPCDLVLVFYDKEEGPHADSGLAPLLDACPFLKDVDLAVVQEPTDNIIQVGCVGSIHASVTFRGTSAHSARPWHGDNAIHNAGDLLAELARRRPREVEIGGHVFREVISATSARGGRYRNVVPDAFELGLNYRFAPGRTLASARAELESIVAGRAEIEFTDLSPSGDVPADEPLFRHLVAQAGADVAPKQAWTDVARLAEAGIAAVNFGPGLTGQAHQRGEYCELPLVASSYRALRRFLEKPMSASRR